MFVLYLPRFRLWVGILYKLIFVLRKLGNYAIHVEGFHFDVIPTENAFVTHNYAVDKSPWPSKRNVHLKLIYSIPTNCLLDLGFLFLSGELQVYCQPKMLYNSNIRIFYGRKHRIAFILASDGHARLLVNYASALCNFML